MFSSGATLPMHLIKSTSLTLRGESRTTSSGDVEAE
jgi:hypothetical protein